MRKLLTVALALAFLAGSVRADDKKDPPKQAPKIVLQSPDGKKTYDLEKLTAEGPVLVRLTCACTGCAAHLSRKVGSRVVARSRPRRPRRT